MVQSAVLDLLALCARLTEALDEQQLGVAERGLRALQTPLGRDDVAALLSLLPADGDGAFGLNWMIVHAIESSPDWPPWDLLTNQDHAWVKHLKLALANAGRHPPA
jgi:hypothetical protein